MNWLAKYYDNRVHQNDRRDFLMHVHHTERGQPLSDAQFQSMLVYIRKTLDLRRDDALLDLCCGNGVFTRHLAANVHQAVGVDFSEGLIAIARMHNQADNLVYDVQDVKDPAGWQHLQGKRFSKILMNTALQHFASSELKPLLQSILAISTRDRVILFTLVPDFGKREAFLKSLKPDFKLWLRRLWGRDLIRWWKRDEVAEIAASLGLRVEFLDVDPALDVSRYRFDIRIW